jgi:hypothetical protein
MQKPMAGLFNAVLLSIPCWGLIGYGISLLV